MMFNTKSCNWGRLIPCTRIGWVLASWKVALQRSIWESWQTTWTWTSNMPLWQRQPKAFLTVLGRILPVGWGRWSSLLLSTGEAHLECCVPVCAPQYRDVLKWEEKRTAEMIFRVGASVIWREAERAGMVWLGEKVSQEYLSKLCEYLIRGSKDDRLRLFPVVYCERTRNGRH